MRHRTLSVVLMVVATLGVADAGVRALAPALPDPAPWPTPETRVKAAQMAELGCVDVVFLGTSVTEAAVDTDRFAGRAYNASLPFSTQRSLALWAEEFVLPALCPEVVVIGVPTWSPGFAMPSDDELLLRGLQMVQDHRERAEMGTLDRHSELIRRRDQLKNLAGMFTSDQRPEESGLWTRTGHQTGYTGRVMQHLPAEHTDYSPPPGVDLEPLRSLVTQLTRGGTTVVLMTEPARCGPIGECLPSWVRTGLLEQYAALAADAGVPLLDLWSDFEPAEFGDAAHLNERGAARFTALLQSALADLGLAG